MNGQIITERTQLDYTNYAPPLSPEKVVDDLQEARLVTGLWKPPANSVVEEIVMWEHQWDWLMKQTAERHPATFELSARYRGGGGNSICGIPVYFKLEAARA